MPATTPSPPRNRRNPLPGYRVIEVTLADGSPAAGTRLGDIRWPAGFLPVSVLRGRPLRQPDPRTVVRSGDRIALLTPDDP
jgi:Trk K+ transport system NAD-binding subunit